jgi:glycosyltransferase involved in cell wall biosynthesis
MKNLKVCMVTDSLFSPGGIATAVRELSYSLALKGLEVQVITCKGKNDDPKKLLKIIKLESKKRPFGLWDLSEASLITSRAINRLVEDFDLIHVHGPIALARFFTMGSRKVPWLITVHGTFQKELPWLKTYPIVNMDMLRYRLGTRLMIGFESWLYRSISSCVGFIAVSQQTKDDLIGIGVNRRKVTVVPNGVNTELYRPMDVDESRAKLRMEKLIGSDKKVVLTVNFIEPRKGIHILIRAFHKVLKEIGDAHCIMVGGSALNGYSQYLARLVTSLGLEKNVHFTGYVQDDVLPYYFSACDVFVLPSLAEGAPLVVPMAMACRKPVVATTACAASEYLEPECTLIPGRQMELAEMLISYLAKDGEASNLADRLYRKAVLELTWGEIANKTMSVYERTLESTVR